MEYSGTVVALTPGDSSTTDPDPLAPGGEVLISGLYAGPRSYGEYQKYGGFATFSVAPRAAVTRVPAQLTMAQAATLNGAYETAYHALVRRISSSTCCPKKHSYIIILKVHCAGVKKGETVLVHGATGATGLAAVQLCSALGVDTVISGGADTKVETVISNNN